MLLHPGRSSHEPSRLERTSLRKSVEWNLGERSQGKEAWTGKQRLPLHQQFAVAVQGQQLPISPHHNTSFKGVLKKTT